MSSPMETFVPRRLLDGFHTFAGLSFILSGFYFLWFTVVGVSSAVPTLATDQGLEWLFYVVVFPVWSGLSCISIGLMWWLATVLERGGFNQ